ncbi:recombinase family protein [Streptomyces anthocyanicus]|uniref:recombinase family protein n=1 Tax=Streptomyces anthocyanicus TaxID=68174 RepID=UPI0036DFFC8D
MENDPYLVIESRDCPTCQSPAGSPCRTSSGRVAGQYHTARFLLHPRLRSELKHTTPKHRNPGAAWERLDAPAIAAASIEGNEIRLGYARCSSSGQELQSQLDALEPVCNKVFKEIISSRIKQRPELEKVIQLARQFTEAGQRVTLVVHEFKRLGRGALDLLQIAEKLRMDGIQLEFLTGPLSGKHDPSGYGSALFAFFAAMAETERDYIRDRTLEGLEVARKKGKTIGRPVVGTSDMSVMAKALKEQGKSVPEIREQLIIPSGKHKGEHPSIRTVYRLLGN